MSRPPSHGGRPSTRDAVADHGEPRRPHDASPRSPTIDDPHVALSVLGEFVDRPIRHESFALLLDHQLRGTAVIHHDRSLHHDDVFDLAADTAAAATPSDTAVVLLSIRPHRAADPHDARRWGVLDDVFHGGGLELIEWFVDGSVLDLPRTRAGVASRWPPPRLLGCGPPR